MGARPEQLRYNVRNDKPSRREEYAHCIVCMRQKGGKRACKNAQSFLLTMVDGLIGRIEASVSSNEQLEEPDDSDSRLLSRLPTGLLVVYESVLPASYERTPVGLKLPFPGMSIGCSHCRVL